MNKGKLSIIIGLTSALIVSYCLTMIYPNIEDLWRENFDWNGLSIFYEQTKPTKIENLDQLETMTNSETTLFFIGPTIGFTALEAKQVHDYLRYGGIVILADDFGSGNQLLELLDLPIRFDSRLLKDQFFRDKNSLMPLISVKSIQDINKIVLNYATVLSNVDQSDVLVKSSPFSFLSTSVDNFSDDYLSYPIIAEINYGEGKLILVSDSSFAVNSMINRGDNKLLLMHLKRGVLLIDESHIEKSNLTLFQELLTKIYTLLGNYEVRYTMVIGFILMTFSLKLTMQEQVLDPVKNVLNAHPEYNREIVEWLETERRKGHE
jgi:hypothetical protein